MHVSLNANELLLIPTPFSRIELLQLVPAKNILFGSDYHVYLAEIMRFKHRTKKKMDVMSPVGF